MKKLLSVLLALSMLLGCVAFASEDDWDTEAYLTEVVGQDYGPAAETPELRDAAGTNGAVVSGKGEASEVGIAVLEAGGALFDGTMTVEDAQQVLQSDIDRLQNAAEDVLAENGMDYGVTVEIGQDFFATRTYDDAVTLPAGVYTAVRVILGNGEGQNWWCVMFPPLCLPAAEGEVTLDDALTEEEEDVVTRSPRFEARFKIVELFEKIAEKIR